SARADRPNVNAVNVSPNAMASVTCENLRTSSSLTLWFYSQSYLCRFPAATRREDGAETISARQALPKIIVSRRSGHDLSRLLGATRLAIGFFRGGRSATVQG